MRAKWNEKRTFFLKEKRDTLNTMVDVRKQERNRNKNFSSRKKSWAYAWMPICPVIIFPIKGGSTPSQLK